MYNSIAYALTRTHSLLKPFLFLLKLFSHLKLVDHDLSALVADVAGVLVGDDLGGQHPAVVVRAASEDGVSVSVGAHAQRAGRDAVLAGASRDPFVCTWNQ